MKIQTLRKLIVAVSWMFALVAAMQVSALPILTLRPADGAITGAAGTTVGWGFALSNPDANFAVITGSDFCLSATPCSDPAVGAYNDFIGAQFIVVGPAPESASVTQDFDSVLQTGVGSFSINATATGVLLGDLVLTFDLFSIDPNAANFDPISDTISVGNLLRAAASVAVRPKVAPVPEPQTLLLTLCGLACVFAIKRRKYAC